MIYHFHPDNLKYKFNYKVLFVAEFQSKLYNAIHSREVFNYENPSAYFIFKEVCD